MLWILRDVDVFMKNKIFKTGGTMTMSKGIYKTMNVGNVLTYDENSIWLCDSITLAKNGNIIFGGYIFCRYLADGYDEL